MATINGMTTNGYSISSLFSNLSTSSSSSSSSSGAISLSDYAAIRNGSYKKLMTAYYSSETSSDSSVDTSSLVKSLTVTSSDATSLAESASALLSNQKLYEKTEITSKDETTGKETTTTDYDWDQLEKKVNAFISAYNDTIDDAGNSTTRSVLQNALWMTKITSQNRSLLGEVGITIGSGNKLELDEDTFKNANMSTIQSVFGSSSGYAAQIQYKASQISSSAAYSASAYTKNGTYTSSASSSYNTLV